MTALQSPGQEGGGQDRAHPVRVCKNQSYRKESYRAIRSKIWQTDMYP